METAAPFKEVIDEVKESGGDAVKFSYQCGKCDTVWPWNRVITFSMRKLTSSLHKRTWVSRSSRLRTAIELTF